MLHTDGTTSMHFPVNSGSNSPPRHQFDAPPWVVSCDPRNMQLRLVHSTRRSPYASVAPPKVLQLQVVCPSTLCVCCTTPLVCP